MPLEMPKAEEGAFDCFLYDWEKIDMPWAEWSKERRPNVDCSVASRVDNGFRE